LLSPPPAPSRPRRPSPGRSARSRRSSSSATRTPARRPRRPASTATDARSHADSTLWVATNGTAWGQYLAGYAGLALHNFALSGATCSNAVTPRPGFSDVVADELGAYDNFTKSTRLDPAHTLYTLWIGTNDVGAGELLTGQAPPGVSVVDTAACAVGVVKSLYERGARKFLFQNVRPQGCMEERRR
jgi:hypothetical protein